MAERSDKCGALCAQAREAREKGNSDQADQYINEALRQHPGDIETRRQLAETIWNSGRRNEAIAHYVALCEQQPNDAKLASRLAVMQWETNQHALAAATATAVLKIDPQLKDAWRIKARSEAEQGKLDDALVSYIRLSQVGPDDLPTLIELGDLHLLRGHPDRACPLYRAAIQHPHATPQQRADTEWRLGVAYARGERWSLAVSILEPAIAERTASADDWCLLAWSRLNGGDLAGAQSDLRRAMERDPKSSTVQQLARQLEKAADSARNPRIVTPAGHWEESNSRPARS